MFRLEIETSNAAFENYPEVETAAILRNLATQIARDGLDETMDGALRDINGNTVGTWQYTPEDSESF